MDIAAKAIAIMGALVSVLGGLWALIGFIKFLQSKKNQDPRGVDEGLEAMIYGGALGIVSAGITAAVISQLNSISF